MSEGLDKNAAWPLLLASLILLALALLFTVIGASALMWQIAQWLDPTVVPIFSATLTSVFSTPFMIVLTMLIVTSRFRKEVARWLTTVTIKGPAGLELSSRLQSAQETVAEREKVVSATESQITSLPNDAVLKESGAVAKKLDPAPNTAASSPAKPFRPKAAVLLGFWKFKFIARELQFDAAAQTILRSFARKPEQTFAEIVVQALGDFDDASRARVSPSLETLRTLGLLEEKIDLYTLTSTGVAFLSAFGLLGEDKLAGLQKIGELELQSS